MDYDENAIEGALVSMGPPEDWKIDPQPKSRGVREACENRRPGKAWASGNHAGWVLHCALCRAAGVDPRAHGVAAALADVIGMSRQNYWRLIKEGEQLGVVKAATRVGLYVVALPPGPDGKLRWVVGDAPTEVSP